MAVVGSGDKERPPVLGSVRTSLVAAGRWSSRSPVTSGCGLTHSSLGHGPLAPDPKPVYHDSALDPTPRNRVPSSHFYRSTGLVSWDRIFGLRPSQEGRPL